jgi:predicted HD phosphohydrolase
MISAATVPAFFGGVHRLAPILVVDTEGSWTVDRVSQFCAEFGAAILKPYISEANHWMLEHHGVFQGYYFFHYLGLDRDLREQFRGHPHFEYTAQFCHLYDQNSFDPAYESMPLEAFTPMMRRVMEKPKHSIYARPAE